ncbi:MAG: hypothetical protein RLZZ303_3537 [Candidatus Hydrogenedentota bacterium]|jgi:glutaredoxin
MATEIILYSAALCGDCQLLKQYMDECGIAYENRDIRDDPEHARVLEEQTGKLGVPYLVIEGVWIKGYQSGLPFSEEFAASLFADI